jgi:hypothetical protein
MNLLNISPLHLSRDVAKEVARGFELRNDADSFEALWEVANEARAVRKENLKSGELDREIAAGAAAGGVTLVGALMEPFVDGVHLGNCGGHCNVDLLDIRRI